MAARRSLSFLCCLHFPFSNPLIPDTHSPSRKSYKQRKEIERKARAGDSVGWNASYVRADTVVDALADRLGVSKGDILDREEVTCPWSWIGMYWNVLGDFYGKSLKFWYGESPG